MTLCKILRFIFLQFHRLGSDISTEVVERED